MQYFHAKKFSVSIILVWLIISLLPNTVIAVNTAIQNKNINNIEVRFNFYPSVFTPNLDESAESIFLVVRGNGETKTVHYGLNFWSDNIIVHQGILPKDYVATLISKVRQAIDVELRTTHYEGGPQDEPVFYLAVNPCNKSVNEQRTIEYLGLLNQTSSVKVLINELRVLWKLLKKEHPAYAYIRRESIGTESPDYIKRDLRFKSVQAIPRKLRPILIKAINNHLDFYALSRPQVTQLSKFISGGSLYLIYQGYGYDLKLYLPKNFPSQPQKGISRNENTMYFSSKTVFAHRT